MDVFPTPRPAPLTDRGVKMFTDTAAFYASTLAKSKTSGGPSGDGSASARSSNSSSNRSSRSTRGGAPEGALSVRSPQSSRVAGERTARQRAADREAFEALAREKRGIEAQLAELDRVLAYKRRMAEKNGLGSKPDRPFATFLHTHRAHPDLAPCTATVTGSWGR